ncbi:hypothetical protein E3O42_10055 [Cryobacterium adonitolivorans]|uniref:Ig-like domain-containing protein n=1 Tax=Cryobacterium adonitolivorans TaxID=1259189 RepID=A0A4R8W409_9MICO|nr:hypothetical protein [Cryobacterium adonitolivorans]TFC01702.1 hypothetical protein E3O42_10055 [Cryobacterium adonitolivorans]
MRELDRGAAARIAALALVVLLAGCAAGPDPSTPTPGDIVVAGVGDEIVLLDCATVVPVTGAAEVLGVRADELAAQWSTDGTTVPATATVSEMMAAEALRSAGHYECRYALAAGATGGPAVSVSMLPDAAAEFARVQSDSNDGLNNMLPADVGDQAFTGCRGGEWQGCRAEILVGTTWLSISVGTPEPDPAALLAYARTVTDSVASLKLARPAGPTRPECGYLLSPHDLTTSAGLNDPSGVDALDLGEPGSLAVAGQIRGGLVSCAWSTEAGSPGVALMILPGRGSWTAMPPGVAVSTAALDPIDLSAESGARWPASGVQALAGCSGDGCTVTLLADGVWLTVTAAGATDSSSATALAVAAYARYVDAV